MILRNEKSFEPTKFHQKALQIIKTEYTIKQEQYKLIIMYIYLLIIFCVSNIVTHFINKDD